MAFWTKKKYTIYISANFEMRPKDIHRLFVFYITRRKKPGEGYVIRKFFEWQLREGWTIRSITIREFDPSRNRGL